MKISNGERGVKGECDEQDGGNGNDEQEEEEEKKRAYGDDNEVSKKMEESRNNINLFESELMVSDVCPD